MKRILSAGFFLGIVSAAFAQGGQNSPTERIIPLGYCQMTGVSTGVLISSQCAIPSRAAWAVLCVEGADGRWRDDATLPTATVGMPIGQDVCLYYEGSLSALGFAAQSGTITVDISFYTGTPRV